MADRQAGFGPFGSGKPVGKRRSRFGVMLFLIVGMLAAIVFAVGRYGTTVTSFYTEMAETNPPEVEFVEVPNGIGTQPVEVSIRVRDSQSGLDQVTIRATQGSDSRDLLRKSYPTRQKDDLITLSLDGRESGFYEGELRLSVVAFDKSFWSNSARSSTEFPIDYKAPSIEVLTRQHNAVQGGVELVFYRLGNDPAAFSGIIASASIFPGFPAISLDRAFADSPQVYFAFFAIPLEFKKEQSTLRLLARDAVGNTTTESIYYRVRSRGSKKGKFKVSKEFLEEQIERSYEQFLLAEAKIGGTSEREYFPAVKDSERIERFAVVNNQYRKLVEEGIKPMMARPKSQLFWRGTFSRPPGKQLSFGFGDTVQWVYEGTVVGETLLSETLYVSKPGRAVPAANAGKVIFVDEFGPYGKTVILDHGFGLTTFYTHLASFECQEGDELAKGESVGRTGSTGLIPAPGVGYQVRLAGVPVRPEEWWDENWIADHIEGKISAVKRELGIRVVKPLEP